MSAHLIPMVPGTISTPSTLDLSRVFVRWTHGEHQQTFAGIKFTVAQAFGVSVAQIDSRRRDARIVWARQVAMHLCRELLDATTTEVGRKFRRDHGTVGYASQTVENRMETEPRVREQIQRLQAQVRGL